MSTVSRSFAFGVFFHSVLQEDFAMGKRLLNAIEWILDVFLVVSLLWGMSWGFSLLASGAATGFGIAVLLFCAVGVLLLVFVFSKSPGLTFVATLVLLLLALLGKIFSTVAEQLTSVLAYAYTPIGAGVLAGVSALIGLRFAGARIGAVRGICRAFKAKRMS